MTTACSAVIPNALRLPNHRKNSYTDVTCYEKSNGNTPLNAQIPKIMGMSRKVQKMAYDNF